MRKRLLLDDLTGLPNRRGIFPTLRRRMRDSGRHKLPFCVALLDIDHFKATNTRFGYDAADSLLREFAKRMIPECRRRRVDLLRYRTGDEFLLVMNGMDEAAGRQFLMDLEQALATAPFRIQGSPHRLTFTAGMRCVDPSKESHPTIRINGILEDCETRLAARKASNGRSSVY